MGCWGGVLRIVGGEGEWFVGGKEGPGIGRYRQVGPVAFIMTWPGSEKNVDSPHNVKPLAQVVGARDERQVYTHYFDPFSEAGPTCSETPPVLLLDSVVGKPRRLLRDAGGPILSPLFRGSYLWYPSRCLHAHINTAASRLEGSSRTQTDS